MQRPAIAGRHHPQASSPHQRCPSFCGRQWLPKVRYRPLSLKPSHPPVAVLSDQSRPLPWPRSSWIVFRAEWRYWCWRSCRNREGRRLSRTDWQQPSPGQARSVLVQSAAPPLPAFQNVVQLPELHWPSHVAPVPSEHPGQYFQLVQHPFCKFCGCWFCAAVLAGAMRARSARSAEDGTAARRNTDRPFPQAISSGHSYPYPRRNRQHGTTRRTSPSGGGFCGAAE